MNRILWLSRHDMTGEQSADLKRIYGDVEIVKVSETVKSAAEVLNFGADCDVLAVVLPPAILADLVKVTVKPVIRAVSERVLTGEKVLNPATGTFEDQYVFKFMYWERVISVTVVTERL